jgi:hypothetical protein
MLLTIIGKLVPKTLTVLTTLRAANPPPFCLVRSRIGCRLQKAPHLLLVWI